VNMSISTSFLCHDFFPVVRAVRIIQVVYVECNNNITYDSIAYLLLY